MCLEQAKHLILAGEQKAIHIGVPMVLAVVDEGGNLTALHRMDGALLASLSIAQAKAFTALALRSPTGESAASVLPGQPLYGLQNTHPGQILSLWRRHSFILRNVLHRSHRRIRRHR